MRWPGDTVATRRLPPLLGPSSPGPTAGSRNLAEGRQVDSPEVKETQFEGIREDAWLLRFGPAINEEDKHTKALSQKLNVFFFLFLHDMFWCYGLTC